MHALGNTTMRCCASVSSNVAQQSSSGSSVCRIAMQQQRQQQRPRVYASKHEAGSSPNSAAAAVAAAAAIVLQSCIAVPQAAQAAAAVETIQQQQQQWQRPVLGELSFAATAPALEEDVDQEESLQEIEDDIMAQVAIPEELTNFMDMLQKGPPKSAAKLSAARKAVGFDRTIDGRVTLFSDDGEPFQVKTDMGVPGALLLRDAGGYMYYIPSTDADSLVQIDLSDDAVVAQLFANHAWEELLEPLEVVTPVAENSRQQQQQQQRRQQEQQQPDGRLEQLRLTERDFRQAISLLRGSQELPEEPLEELDAQERQ